MKKKLTTVLATALLGSVGLLAVPVDSASAAGGWKLHSTRTIGGQTFYRYTNSSGGVLLTDHPVGSNGSGWLAV